MQLKFHDVTDFQQFLLEMEINPVSVVAVKTLEDYTPSEEMWELFFKRRRTISGKLKDFRKSQSAKQSWRHNRRSFIKGMRSFHKSTTGKRNHRALSRFLMTREQRGLQGLIKSDESLANNILETLKALSSLRTHLYIERSYYHPIDEQVDFDILSELIIDSALRVESQLIKGDFNLMDEDVENLFLSIPNQDIIAAVRESAGKEVDLSSINEDSFSTCTEYVRKILESV